MTWVRPAEWSAGVVLALLAVLAMLALVGLFLRRRLLSGSARVFDCAANLRPDAQNGWAAGFARYERDEFQWFRTFSVAVGPSLVIPRRGARIVEHRELEASERRDLPDLTSVLRVEVPTRTASRMVELALSSGSVTGLMSWLEAAPPGPERP